MQKAQHFPLINNLETDFYLPGWSLAACDSEYIFNFLVHSRGAKYGSWNVARFGDAHLDAKIKALASDTDLPQRNRMIAEIWQAVQAGQINVPPTIRR